MPLSPGKLRYELELMPLRIYGTRTHLFAEATMVDSMPRIDRPVFVCYHPEACFAHGLKNAVTVQHIERIRCMISSLGFNMTTPSASLVRLNRSRPPKEKKTREIRYQSQLTAKGEKGDDTIDTEQDSSFRWTRTNRYDDLEKLLSRYCKEVLTGTPADMDDIPEHLHHYLDYVYDIYMAAKAPAFASFRHTAALLRTLPPTDEMKWLTMCVGPDVVTLLRSPLADALVDSKIVPALHSLLQELKKERNTSSNARLHPRLRYILQRGCITVPSQKEMTTICARLRWAAKMYKIEQASLEKQIKEAITKARNSRTKLWARSIARTIVPTSEILNLDHPYNKSVDAAKFIKDLGENG
ncbi:unnamed protein product [Zymoseptoria tritici ST99CH_1E4]|uniref:Uncharacterized protein n=1 Tax=Zymoseptoria tritici ST99CH_1E4 TaxID=1276532 RepID=A0A2H1FXG9_ZYMTR|nr:unnamed protein product [Zymoseptoria tritici ST99CH_1E4]